MLLSIFPSTSVFAVSEEPVQTESSEDIISTEDNSEDYDITTETSTELLTTEIASEEQKEEKSEEALEDETTTEEDVSNEEEANLDNAISEMANVGDNITMDTVVSSYATGKVVYKLPSTDAFTLINKSGKGINKYGGGKTSYGSGSGQMQCAEYVYRSLVDAGVLKAASSVKTECNDLYSYMIKNGWELVIKPQITKTSASKKTVLTNSNWKSAVAAASSAKAHAAVMDYVKSGKIKAGDVMFFVKEGSSADSKYEHVAIVTRDVVTAGNGHGDTLVISHATTYADGAYFTGKNGRGYLNDSLRNNTWTWEKSVGDVDFVTESDLDHYLSEQGGAGVGFAIVRMEESNKYTYLQVYKKSFSENLTNGNPNYDTNGIEYNVSVGGKVIDSVTLEEIDDSTGYAESDILKIDMGTEDSIKVDITEDAASLDGSGFIHNDAVYTATLKECKKADAYNIGVDLLTDEVGDYANPGAVQLHKVSGGGLSNDMYSLAGATYNLVNALGQNVMWYPTATDATYNTNGSVAPLTTDENGDTPIAYVPYGTYYFQEVTPSKGHLLHQCGMTHMVTVTPASPSGSVTCEEPVTVDPVMIDILKVDINDETKTENLTGAVFALKFYEGNYTKNNISGTPRTYYMATYTGSDGRPMPANLSDPNSVEAAKQLGYGSADFYSSNGKYGLLQGTFTIEEIKAPAGFELNKQKIIVNGEELNDRLIYGQLIRKSDTDGSLNLFIEGKQASSGASVQILVENEEKRADISLVKKDYITGEPLEGIAFRITDDITKESHIIVTDKEGVADTSAEYMLHSTDTNGYDEKYSKSATLKAKESGIWFYGPANANVDDKKGALLTNHTYTIEELVCPSNAGKRRLIRPLNVKIKDDDNALTIDLGTVTNVGRIELASLAVCEDTASHIAYPSKTIHISDEVSYKFLTAGDTYTLKGIIMEILEENGKKTVIPATDSEGNYIRANHTFTTDSAFDVTEQEKAGSETVSFVFNGINAENKTYVLYEYLFAGEDNDLIPIKTDEKGKFMGVDDSGAVLDSAEGEPVKHTDMDDEDQKVVFPSIETNAWADETSTGVVLATESTKITDTVTYKNLLPDTEYSLYARIMYKEDDSDPKVLLDGNDRPIEVLRPFKTTADNGSIDVELPLFDARPLVGNKVVIYEKLFSGNFSSADELTKQQSIATHEDYNDPGQTVYIPDVHTTAKDKETLDKNSLAGKAMTIIDTVKYKGLLPGKEYTIYGSLKDKDSGTSIIDSTTGAEVTSNVTFTPDEPDGEVEITFAFDGSALAGKTIVAFESIEYDRKRIAVHEDINDIDQSIFIPEIKTSLRDSELGIKNTYIDNEVTLIDTVSYSNLIEGYKYKISGYLMNKDTNEPILIGGSRIESEASFVAKSTDSEQTEKKPEDEEKKVKVVSGTIDVTYTFDGTLAGLMHEDGTSATIVCFEKLEVAQDYAEQGHYEEKTTEAYDEKTYETVLICDKCGENLSKLSLGEFAEHTAKHGSYTETLIEGDPIHHEAENDRHYIKDADAVTKDVVVALHEDINDVDQTVVVARGKTTAKGDKSKENVVLPDEKVTIIDTVYYTGLDINKTYTLKGTLYKKTANPEPLLDNGIPVTAETVFTPVTANGAVDVTFTFNASELVGESIVVFEDCLYEGKPVFTHADIEDDNQTVHFPKVGTKAADKKGNNKISDTDVVLIDTISYKNLKPGIKYTAYGKIMDAETGKQIKVNGKAVKAKKEFKPKTADGSVNVEFTFSAKGLEGHKLVVFEDVRVSSSDVSIGKHEDLTDKDQTVKISDKLSPPKTGQFPVMILLIFTTICSGALLLFRRKRI